MSYGSNYKLHSHLLLVATACMAASVGGAQTFTPPAVVASSVSATYAPAGVSGIQSVDADSSGNIYYANPGAGQLYQQPSNGGAPVLLYTLGSGGGGYPKGIAVDHIGNAYITDYSGHLWQVPANGGAAVDVLAPCNPIDGYYLGTQTVAVDGSNNIYTAGNNESSIFKITQSGTCSIVATGDGNSFVAADGAGDVFFSVGGTNIDELPAASTTATQIATGLAAINGLRADALGNLFVTNQSTIDEIPHSNGAIDGVARFSIIPTSSANSVGVGPTGAIYLTNGTTVSDYAVGALNLGASAVGTQSPASTVNLIFNSNETVTALQFTSGASPSTEVVNSGAGTCALPGAYSAGSSCTLTLTLNPSGLGARQDSLQLLTSAGRVGALSISGQGTGAGLTIDPGTQLALGAGWSAPSGIAVDGSGNIFIADKTAGTVSWIASGSSTATVIASGIASPGSLAVAGDGSVYIAADGSETLLEIPRSNGVFGTAATAASGFTQIAGVAVGINGDVYVSDTTAPAVYRYPNTAGVVDFATQQALGSGYTAPTGLAVDASGSLYIADETAGTISKISGLSQTSALSGLSSPIALAIVPSGTLFVASHGSTTIEEIPFVSGGYNLNSTSQLGTGLASPSAVAVDSAGNLYIADSTLPAAIELQRTAATLNLGRFNLGESSATQSLTLSNSGTASAMFASPLYAASGDTSDFSVTTSGSGYCAAGSTLTTGSSCAISATFTPTATGARSEVLTFGSNAVNGSQTATLAGTGINLPKTTTTLTQLTPNPISFGESVPVSMTVTPQTGSGAPTGSVQLYVNGNIYGATAPLNSGTASVTISGLPAGADTITAVYSGDNNFAPSSASALIINVSLAATSNTLTSTISSTTPVPPGTSVTLTATITSNINSAAPSGAVTFTGNGQTLAVEPISGGVATLTSTTLPTGTYAVTATYSGDAGFAASTSNSITISILPPQFLISAAPTALTVSAPGSVTTSFVVTPISGYLGGVDMQCSGLPANTQCSFIPGTISFQNSTNASGATVPPGPQTIQLTLTTRTAPPTTVAWIIWPFGALLMLGVARARKLRISALHLAIGATLFATLLGLSGCGTPAPPTPMGSSTVTVTLIGTPSGTTTTIPTSGAGNLTTSFTFTLAVK